MIYLRKITTICHSLNTYLYFISRLLILETDEDCIDEGIEEGDKRWDDETEEERNNTKELEHIIEVSRITKTTTTLTFSVAFRHFGRLLINWQNTNAN